MTLIEFVGFIITMILVIYLSSKRAIQERKQKLDPNYDGDEEVDNIHEMARLLNLSPEDEQALEQELRGESAPPPNPVQQRVKPPKKKRVSRTLSDKYALHTNIENFKPRSKVAERKYDTKIEHRYEKPRESIINEGLRTAPEVDPYALLHKKKARINKLLYSLDSKNDMIVIHELLGRPKALKDDTIHW